MGAVALRLGIEAAVARVAPSQSKSPDVFGAKLLIVPPLSCRYNWVLDSAPVHDGFKVPAASLATASRPAATLTVDGFHSVSIVITFAPDMVRGAATLI